MRPRKSAVALVIVVVLLTSGCAGLFESLGAAGAYRRVSLPEDRVKLDLAYRLDASANPKKHRLDLFLPESGAEGWPTLIFVHGGGWTEGDRATRVLGVEPPRNIGRFYASRGIGAAIVSYRLQPGVSWREQVEDVADATAWIHDHVARFGGDPEALFLTGHSAGAWLAAWVGLNDAPLARLQKTRSSLCGLGLVSGAGYDMTDEETYELGANRDYFQRLFGDDDPDWAEAASIRKHLDSPIPPTLILSGDREPEKFRRQGDLLFEAIMSRSPITKRLVASGQDHQRIVVSMSRAESQVSESILDFLVEAGCLADRQQGPTGS